MTASPPERRRCRRAGRTTPTPTSTSTPRAGPTRRRCCLRLWEGGLHPNGAIDLFYSDDDGLHWIRGNGGDDLEPNNNQTSLAVDHVEDKQWVAVNHFA